MSGLKLQGIAAMFGGELAAKHSGIPWYKLRKLEKIARCRTEEAGAVRLSCGACGEPIGEVYRSCGDPDCPVCGSLKKAAWLDSAMSLLLPVPLFHAVFTIPSALNTYYLQDQEMLCRVLSKAATDTLNEFAARAGVQLGMIRVIHTFGRTMSIHPHAHFIVTGGGLDLAVLAKSRQADPKHPVYKWKSLPHVRCGDEGPDGGEDQCGDAREDGDDDRRYFLFPVGKLGGAFRARFMQLLDMELARKGAKMPRAVRALCECKPWVVFCKHAPEPDLGAPPDQRKQSLLEYLARYVYGSAIYDSRIVDYGRQGVTYDYKDYRRGGEVRTVTMAGTDFLLRYTYHFRAPHARRAAYCGIYSPRNRAVLISLQEAMSVKPAPPKMARKSRSEILLALGRKPAPCPCCGSFKRTVRPVGPGPPLALAPRA